ncbi:hypothetical protein DY000_02004780 [Brassica cretica]|uniref:Uncharacterized protein n=1 Tax=Brassica cretica TaxID=69181 RepID=A0ABQ7CBX9_BRACR|nr:hypothetical protein DY000_02004780 [Brassica cretica]
MRIHETRVHRKNYVPTENIPRTLPTQSVPRRWTKGSIEFSGYGKDFGKDIRKLRFRKGLVVIFVEDLRISGSRSWRHPIQETCTTLFALPQLNRVVTEPKHSSEFLYVVDIEGLKTDYSSKGEEDAYKVCRASIGCVPPLEIPIRRFAFRC